MKSLILEIADKFSAADLTWALGGSLALRRHGVVNRANDVDIFVVPEDFDKADAILKTMGQTVTVPPHPRFASLQYRKFIINGIEVDLMAEFQIKTDDGVYAYLFDKSSITKKDIFAKGCVNYTSIEDWYILYLLLDRAEDSEKIKAITSYLQKNGVAHKSLLKRALKAAPAKIRELAALMLNYHLKP